ncbi:MULTISPECIES: hypothetical protein [unclassified Acinetobacter]|uniref:hypothetical protein n=1 Tax=unclassified Acinetobacter TaxID=196816 RepID=UPI0025769FE1|nr:MULTISPECIES: hypothetical protein [unclassified Acinetobacter]MDM1762789.1 hypothetical protein [Acinetobacter sp. 226-1]MDM1766268.1 hypothetical protein [Acinetobacter sp. 226-4]
MKKKNDVFGQKLKLTKKEKAKHKSRMEKFEILSLYWIQIQRLFEMLYTYLVQLGELVFPNEQIKKKLFDLLIKLITKFGWFIVTPILFQFISDQFAVTTLINNFLM